MWCFWVKTFYEVFLFIFTVAVDFAMYRVPLDLFVLLGRKGNPRSEQGFSFLPKTHLPFLALLRGVPLRTCMGFGVFVILKPADFSCAENVSCRLFSGQFIQVCLWQTCSEQKTGLNLQNQVLLFAPPLDPHSLSRPA